MLNIIVSDHLHAAGWEILHKDPAVTVQGPFAGRDEVLAHLAGADALIVRSSTVVDLPLLEAAPNLKVVARAGARLDNVDIEVATRRGIMVNHVPDASLIAMAEHTFAMLLALARAIPTGYNAVRAGQWPRHTMLGFELHGKQLGIIGLGNLGRAVAARAQAFGMSVLAYDPNIDFAFARQQGFEIVDLDELLARADIVTVHLACIPQTECMLDAEAFARMKTGSYLVNCTHAELVDEGALLAALESGRLAGAALDTFSQEPPPAGHPLVEHPRVIVAPHLNQNTVESQSAVSAQVVRDVLAALRAEDYRNVVNLPFTVEVPYQAVRPYINLAVRLGKLQGQLAEGWITRLEVELLGEGMQPLVRPVAAVLLSGMLLPVDRRAVNWVSAPVLAHEQGIVTAQAKGLVQLEDYPNLIACRAYWAGGQLTVAGVLFGDGEARLVQYNQFHVDAYPQGYVLFLENEDVPGVIGKVGGLLGQAGINIAQWRYGREARGGRAVSFINLDDRAPASVLAEIERYPEIHRARLVRL